MFASGPAPGLLGRPHLDPRRQGLLAIAGSVDADDRAHANAWRHRLLRQRWCRQRGEEEARERYRKGLIGAFAAGDAEGLLSGATRGSSAGGTGFDLGNIGRGIGERAGDLGGGLLGAVNTAAGYLERQIPLGGIDLERGVYGPDAPPERNLGHVAARRLKDLDLGYAPGTTWAEVKRSPASKAIPFAVEQGLVSAPDMAAALTSLPAYVLARTGGLAEERAEADLRKDATVGDLVAALPGAVASALLERLGARGILGIGDALKSRSLRGVAGATARGSAKESLTETGQEGIEHATARLGTATGVAPHEMADAMMAGGAAGAIFGGGVRGATATGETLLGRPQVRESGASRPEAPSVPPTPSEAEAEATGVPAGGHDGTTPGAGTGRLLRPADLPKVPISTTLAKLKAHPRHGAAKAGDGQAADDLIAALFTPDWPTSATTGPVLGATRNIARGRAAVDEVLGNRGSVPAAMVRDDVGEITFDWGNPGTPGRSYLDGHGFSHIIARRDLEGRDGERFAREAIPEALARGKLDRIHGPPNGRRAEIVYDGNRVVLSLYRFGERETWVLTGYRDENGGPGGRQGVNPRPPYAR